MAFNRKRPDPILMGEPSPSLSKIQRMNTQRLTEHVKALDLEIVRITEKVKNLSNMRPPNEARVQSLTTQLARLTALSKVASTQLSGKIERGQRYNSGEGPRRRR